VEGRCRRPGPAARRRGLSAEQAAHRCGRQIGPHEPDIDGIHAGGADGLHAEIRVLEATASGGIHADALGGGEEDVGGGLLTGHILVGDHGIEPLEDIQMAQDAMDGVPGSAGSDGHGKDAAVFAGDGDDGFHGTDMGKVLEVEFLLFVGERDGIDVRPILFVGQHAEDVACGNTSERVEAGLGEIEAMPGGELRPGEPVERHGVGEGSIAIEDETGGDEVGHGMGIRFEWRKDVPERRVRPVRRGWDPSPLR